MTGNLGQVEADWMESSTIKGLGDAFLFLDTTRSIGLRWIRGSEGADAVFFPSVLTRG